MVHVEFIFDMSLFMRKTDFCICENKDADQLRGNAKLISAFVFATKIVQRLYFLNTKFQASSHLLWLYSPVYVGPGRKPRRPVFSQRGSYNGYPQHMILWRRIILVLLGRFYFSRFLKWAASWENQRSGFRPGPTQTKLYSYRSG